MRLSAIACLLLTVAPATAAEPIAGPGTLPWWRSPTMLALGLALTGLLALGLRRLSRPTRTVTQTHDQPHDDPLIKALRRVENEGLIDGYALWDEGQRLVDVSGMLARYLPELAEWRRPHARGLPALRELRLGDGQVFLGRNVDLGDRRTASIFTNATLLREGGQAPRATEAPFRTAFECGPSMMLLLDAEETPLAINRAFRTNLGYTLDHLIQAGWRVLVHPDDAGDSAPPWVPTVKRLITADGAVLRGQIRFTPVRDADGRQDDRLLLVTIDDLTTRWDAEERVRFQASLLERVGTAVLAVDCHGRILYGNRAAQSLFQWNDQDLLGAPIDRLLDAPLKDAMAGDDVALECEGRTWSNGRFPAAVTFAHTADETGNPAGAVLAVTDLTQRRALDLRLMQSAQLATLGDMAAGIAHEFNQCLHIIRLASEALRYEVADGRLEAGRCVKRADNILSQVDRLTEMVAQMRAAPPAPPSSPQLPDAAEDDEPAGDRRRLLLVDDEALSVMMVGEFLERLGYVVDKAYDGIEAQALCECHVYDAVITDIRMPRMDGRALIAQLERLQPGTPVIVVTGHLKEGDGADLGPNVMTVLPKPFQLAHLRAQLNRLETAGHAAPPPQFVEGE